jgi:hypothetical protein
MEKPRLRGQRAECLRISCRASYGPGLIGYQTGARVVRQAQERTVPEYIRPGTASSMLAVTPAAVEVHNNVRWGKLDIRIDIQFASRTGWPFGRSLARLEGPEHVTSNCRSLSA